MRLQNQNALNSQQYFKMRQNRKNWSHEEDQSIISLVKKYGTKRWTLISQKMRQRFPQQGRSGKQCRQRWHNHLSPIINKQPWSEQQIKLVFDSHRKLGNRWTQIAQLLSGRTDNAVKNQFYSTLRKGLRRICKILGTRNSTTRIKKIKPSALSTLISNITEIPISQGDNEQELYDLLFQFSNGDKYEQLKQKSVNEKYRQKMETLLQKILDSKDFGKKKKNKPISKQSYNELLDQQVLSQQENDQSSKQKVGEKEIFINQKVVQQANNDGKFNFDINFDEQQEVKENFNYFSPGNRSQLMQFLLPHQDFDERLERPISLKKENSQHQFIRDEDQLITLKKRSSQNQRAIKKCNQMDLLNNENQYRCFLSKSPNFSSRMKMPTPRLNQNFNFYAFESNAKCEQPQKQCNDILEQIRCKIGSRADKDRIR